MLAAGAISSDATWRFPLATDAGRSPEELLDELNRANDGRAAERLQNYLVRQLRTWRPDVVVTHLVAQPETYPLGSLVEQLVQQALAAAADPNQHVDLSDELGLTPWQVKKVYGVLPAGWRGEERVGHRRVRAAARGDARRLGRAGTTDDLHSDRRRPGSN